MNWQYTPYTLPLLAAAAVSAGLALYAWRRRPAPDAAPFALLMVALAWWSLGYALELGSADLTTKQFWVKVQYIASESLSLTWLVFVLQYTGRRRWLTGRRLALLAIVPLITVLLMWTNELHGLILSNVSLDTAGPISVLVPTYGAWFWVDEVYTYLLLASGTWLLIRAFLRSPQPYRGQAGALLVGALAPWVAEALSVFGLNPFPHLDLTPFAFTVAGLTLGWGLFRFRLLDIVPVARDRVIENVSDAENALRESEAKLRLTLEQMPAVIWTTDTRLRFTSSLGAGLAALNLRPNQVVGMTLFEYFQTDDSEFPPIVAHRKALEGESVAYELEWAGNAYQSHVEPLRDTEGLIVGCIGLALDITAHKRAEEALRGSEARYQALYHNAPDLYDTLGPDGTILDINETGARMLGYTREELIGRHVSQILRPEFHDRVREEFASSQERPEPFEMEVPYRCKDGRTLWCHLRTEWIRDDAGQVLSSRGIARDITERKEAEQRLARLNDCFLSLGADPHENIDRLTALCGELMGATCALYNRLDRGLLCSWGRWGTPPEYDPVDKPEGHICYDVIQRGTDDVIVVRNLSETRYAETDPNVIPYKLQTCIGRAVKFDDTCVGSLCAVFQEDFIPTEQDEWVIGAIASTIAVEEERRARQRHLALLNDITLAAVETLDFQAMMQTIADRLGELIDADGCYITLWDEARQIAIPGAAYGELRETYPLSPAEPGEVTMTESVLRAGHALVAEDVFNTPYLSPHIAAQYPARSLLGLPLIASDQKLGAALIAFNEPHHFAPDEIARGEQAARQIALAVAKARLLEETRLRARRQAALVRLSADLAATLDEDEICRRVVQRLHDMLGYAQQGIFLVDETTGERVCRASMGWPDAPADWRIPPGQGLTERALLDGQLHYTPDVTQDPDYVPGLGSGAEVDVPIYVGGQVIGVLSVESREPHAFGPDDFEVLNAAANQAGIAMSNARSLEVAQRRAQEAETLQEAGAVVAATLQQDEAIQRILEQLAQVMPYDSASVQLLREGCVEIVGGRGWAEPASVVGLRFPVPADNPNTVVIQERRPYLLDDAPAAHAQFRDDPHSHIRSWLGVPLIVGDRVIGMVTVDSSQPNHFTADHARLATAFADQVAIALENAWLFQAEHNHSRELEALRQASLHLTSSLELQPVLEAILHHTLRLVAATDVHIFLYDGARLTFGAALWANGRQQTPYVEPRADGLTYTIARSGERVIVPDVNTHPLFRDWPWGGAIAGLPLHIGDRVVGVMNVAFSSPHIFDEDELRVLELFADQAAIALANARLFQAEQRRREVGAALLEIARVAGSSLELKQILKQSARLTAEACQTDRCSIFLLDDAQEYLQPVMSQLADGHVEPEMWQRFKATTADRVDVVPLFRDAIRQRGPTRLDDPTRTDLIPRKWTEPFGIQKLLVVPLISHDRVIGLMALDYTAAEREFTPEQIELAQTIGGQVAVSIENAQLYARTQQLAITDSLTGWYNRRGFFELGRRELERARRFGRPLTAIMFDLDHFKRVNDTYGHATGDQVLAGLAELCRHELREVDLLGRYGGEEFAVLLPESGLTIARPVGERLRRRVEQGIFNTNRGPIKITISLGVTALDEKSTDLEGLIERADQALYAAKRAGRNRVCVWGRNDE